MNTYNEIVENLTNTLKQYEAMKLDYTNQMDVIKSKIDKLVNEEQCSYQSSRVRDLTAAYENILVGFRGVTSYIENLNARLEAIKNDPNNDNDFRYTI